MARIVILGISETSRSQLMRLLSSSGYEVFRVCSTGSELRRTLSACEDGVVVIAGAAVDILPDELADDFGDSFRILLVGRPEVLAACESPRVFKLAYPCPGSAVLAAVEMLSQLHAMAMPRRVGEDKALVERAKALLMRRDGLSEAQAHRFMQQYAMRHGVRMTDYAAELLRDE